MAIEKPLRIGLVLSQVPGYSETFFNNKLRGLTEEGHTVYLFISVNRSAKYKQAKVIYGPVLSGNKSKKLYVSLLSLIKLTFTSPRVAIRYFKLERQTGSTMSATLRRMIINSHILPHRLDWIHFGFATMGINREFVGKAIGAKVAVSLRGYDIYVYPVKHPGCYITLFAYIDKVHTISEGLLNEAYKIGLPKEIITEKITPAIDTKRFLYIRPFILTGETINIITSARLHWIKGLEYVLEALALVKETGIKFTYKIIGDGADLERLMFACHQLGLQDCVEFIGRKIHTELPDILKFGDIYLQYSIQEGFCNSVLEAQAAGMLCIVSDADGLRENVLDGITGWVVPKRRPDLLAQKIIEIIKMPHANLLAVSNNAAERVKKEFDLEKQRQEFVNFYRD